MLYGMADTFKNSLVEMGIRVREYDPIGEMLPGLSYLVRRLLENSSNDSFLKQSFLNKTGIHELLKNPKTK
ncbi:MAG: 1-pyrroline-5-carboxylate dehydrogenase, partial [Bacteriovoracaceae bacterium]|nr:1-pyrroline-5-carboxylate dehydrogenase [Bacteriovoracaceae bacterium]